MQVRGKLKQINCRICGYFEEIKGISAKEFSHCCLFWGIFMEQPKEGCEFIKQK